MDATDHTTNHGTTAGIGPGRTADPAPGDAFAPRPVGQPEPLTGDPDTLCIEPLDRATPRAVYLGIDQPGDEQPGTDQPGEEQPGDERPGGAATEVGPGLAGPDAGGLRAADPADPSRRDVAPAGSVLAVMVASLLLAAVVNATAMLERAESQPLGLGRDLAVAFWEPVRDLSDRAGLTGPRRALDVVRGWFSEPAPGGLVVAAPPTPEAPSAPAGPTADPGGVAGLSDLARAGLDDDPRSDPEGATPPRSGAVAAPTSTTDPSATPTPTTPAAAPTTAATAAAPTTAATGSGDVSGPPGATASALRRPTPAAPLRVLVVGDSTMDALGPAILRELAGTGVTDAALDYRVSSGLSRPDFFDWPGHLASIRAQTGTELVVLMLGANDAQPFEIDGRPEPFGTDLWIATYRARVAGLLEQLTSDGAGVVWIGLPAMRQTSYDRNMQLLTGIYAEEVARFPRAVYLDSRPLLSDPDGGYTAFVVDRAGDRQRMRRDDGIHLTEAGGDHLTPIVVEAINRLAPLY